MKDTTKAPRKRNAFRWYKGAMISPYSGHAPYGWRWESYVAGSGFLYADTLAGIKSLIRNASA